MLITERLNLWLEASIDEYPSSGHEHDIFAVASDGTSIYVEIIWTPTPTNFYRDINMIQQSDADVKIIVANPKILLNQSLSREFAKVAISQRRLGFAFYGKMIDGSKILENQDYLDVDFKTLVYDQIKYWNSQGKPIREEREFVPPPILPLSEIREDLISNLFYVRSYPKTIFYAPTFVRNNEELLKELGKEVEEIPYLLRHKMIYTFDNLNDSDLFTPVLTDDIIFQINTEDWLKKDVYKNDLIYLMNLSLEKYCIKRGMNYNYKRKRYICQLRDGEDNVFEWRSGSRYSKRAVAKLVYSKSGELLYCRHYAAALRFMFLGDSLLLRIEPTITFTKDGYAPVGPRRLHSLMRRWIPKQYNSAYLLLVRFWAKYLSRLSVVISIPSGNQTIEVSAIPMITKLQKEWQ